MKRITLLLLVLPVMATAQLKLKSHIAPAACMFVSGMAEGVGDYLQFHYDGSSQFWQPDISYKNKYRNHDPAQGMTFRGKYLVFTTDGWHLMKGINHAAMTAAVVIHPYNKKKWYWYIVEGAAYWIINRAGFVLAYNVIWK